MPHQVQPTTSPRCTDVHGVTFVVVERDDFVERGQRGFLLAMLLVVWPHTQLECVGVDVDPSEKGSLGTENQQCNVSLIAVTLSSSIRSCGHTGDGLC